MNPDDNHPFTVTVEEGQLYSWCTCGLSQTQPFCDGSHRGRSDKKSLKWVAPFSGPVSFCGCKQTHTAPLCDHTHLNICKSS